MPRRLRLRRHAERRAVLHVVRIQVAVRLLRGDHVRDDFFCRHAQFRTVARLQGEAHRLGPLVNIGIGIYGADLLGVALPGEAAEIVHAAVGFEQIVHGGDALRHVNLAARGPEAALNGDGADGHRSQLRVGRFCEVDDALVLPRRCVRERHFGLPAAAAGGLGNRRQESAANRQRGNGRAGNRRSHKLPA